MKQKRDKKNKKTFNIKDGSKKETDQSSKNQPKEDKPQKANEENIKVEQVQVQEQQGKFNRGERQKKVPTIIVSNTELDSSRPFTHDMDKSHIDHSKIKSISDFSSNNLHNQSSVHDMATSMHMLQKSMNMSNAGHIVDEIDSPHKPRKLSTNSTIRSSNNLVNRKLSSSSSSQISVLEDHESEIKKYNLNELIPVKEGPSRVKMTGKIVLGVLLSVTISTFFVLLGIQLSDECTMNLFNSSKCVKTPQMVAETGQEKNLVKINYKEKYIYTYDYKVNQEQKKLGQKQKDNQKRLLAGDGELNFSGLKDQGQLDQFGLQFICANITDTHFNFFLIINSLTQQTTGGLCKTKSGKDCNTFYDGYPGMLKTLQPGYNGEKRRMLEETIRVEGHYMTEEQESMFESVQKLALLSQQQNEAAFERLKRKRMLEDKEQQKDPLEELRNQKQDKLDFKSQSDKSIEEGKKTGFEKDIEDPVNGKSSTLKKAIKDEEDDGEIKPDRQLFHEIHDAKIAKELGLTKAQYMVSFIPIIYFQINKNGTIGEIQRPVQIRDEFFVALPNIFKQFAPVLLKSVYDGEQNIGEQNAFGAVKPKFSAETQGDQTLLKNKQKQNAVESTEARSSYQEQKTTSSNKIEGGILKSSTATSSLSIKAKPDEQAESQRAKGEPSNDLLGDMNVNQKTELNLVEHKSAELTYINDIQDMFSKMALVKESYAEFLEDKAIVEKQMMNTDVTKKQDDKDFKGKYEDGEGNPISESKIRRILAAGDRVFPKQYVALFKKNANGMKLESYMGLECFETSASAAAASKSKTTSSASRNKSKKTIASFGQNQLSGPRDFRSLLKSNFKANLKTVVKAVNWFRIRVLEGITTFGKNVTTNFEELASQATTVIDNIGNYIDPKENQLTRPVFVIKDTINNVVEYSYKNFTSFLTEQTTIFSRLIKGPIHRIEHGLNQTTTRIFKLISSNNEILLRSFKAQVTGLSDFIKNSGELALKDKKIIEKVKFEYERLKKYYVTGPLDNVMSIYDTDGVGLMKNFVQNFGTVFDDIKNFKNNRARGSAIAKTIMANFFKVMMSGFVNKVVYRTKEQQEANIVKTKKLLKETLDKKYKEMDQMFYDLDKLVSTYHIQTADSFLQKANLELMRNGGIYNNKAVDIQKSIIATASDKLVKDSSQLLIKYVLDDLRDAQESFVEFKENIQATFTGAKTDITESVTGIKGKIQKQFKDTKDSFKGLFNKTKEFFSEGISALKVLIKGGNEEENLTEAQTLDFYNLGEDIDKIKTSGQNGVKNITGVIDKVKGLPKKFDEFKTEIKKLFTDPFERIKKLEWKIDVPDLSFFDPRELATLMSDGVKDDKKSIEDTNKKEIEEKGATEVSNFDQSAKDEGNIMSKFMSGDVFSQLGDINFLFKEVFLKLLRRFEFQIGPYTLGKPFQKRLEYNFYIPTPIGFPVTIGIYAQFKAYAYWGLKIKGLGLEFYGGGRASCSVGAWGGFGIPRVLKIGAYFEGIIFDGSLQLELAAGFSNKFYGKITAKLYIEALKFKAGIFVQYITIEIRYKCLLKRRELASAQQLNQPALFSEQIQIDSNSPNTEYEIIQDEDDYQEDYEVENNKINFLPKKQQTKSAISSKECRNKKDQEKIRKLLNIASQINRKITQDGKEFVMYGRGRRNLCFRGFIRKVVKAVVHFFKQLIKLCLPYPVIGFSDPKDLFPPVITPPLFKVEKTLFSFKI